LHEADPADKAEIFRQLGLKLTYHPWGWPALRPRAAGALDPERKSPWVVAETL